MISCINELTIYPYILFLSSILYIQTMGSNNLEFSTVSISSSDKFPHYSDKYFYIQFSPRFEKFPIFSVLIYIIRDGIEVKEKGYFHPGFYFEVAFPFIGKYFELLLPTIEKKHSISLKIKFNINANFKHFEIRYGEYGSQEKMLFAMKNYLLYTSVKYSNIVHLYIRTQIEMKTMTMDGRTDGLLVDEPGYLFCKGSRGYPEHRVEISGHSQYEVLDSEFDSLTNTHKIKAVFRLHNHKSKFQCSAQDSEAEYEINIFHHPTKLHLEPYYYRSVPNGSSVYCVADDGYPEPTIQWYFINGPPNYDWFFNIYKNQLFILSNAPIDSYWIFNCVAENVIPNSNTNSTNLWFKFTITNSSSRTFIIMTASAATAVIILVIIIVLVLIFRPRRSPGNKKRIPVTNSQTVVRKELAFDPDTAGSLRLSSSTECLPDELPKYDESEKSDRKFPDTKPIPKDDNSVNTCYV